MAYLTTTLTAIIGYKQSKINELLPWSHLSLWDKRRH
ncbi:hypothetical protein [Agrobacterium vaccinii]|nr:hypothetical protein [Agrobacterium vaccinii]UHS58392.1 hypothetical protein HRS00_15840 [Agrobacterium vaccinii]